MPYPHQSNGNGGQYRPPERVVRFGVYEFRPGTQELRKHGIRLKVQAKPLKILQALTNRAGELVTRQELCNELWPEGTFVDFESGLNTATNRLRVALNDSAERPLYIETLPRLGYRFICPVIEDEPPRMPEIEVPPTEDATGPNSPSETVAGANIARVGVMVLVSAVFLVIAAYLVIGTR